MVLDRYTGYLDVISDNFINKMLNSEDITHDNFVHWANHIEAVKSRYKTALSIKSVADNKRIEMRKVTRTFTQECNKIVAWAIKNDNLL